MIWVCCTRIAVCTVDIRYSIYHICTCMCVQVQRTFTLLTAMRVSHAPHSDYSNAKKYFMLPAQRYFNSCAQVTHDYTLLITSYRLVEVHHVYITFKCEKSVFYRSFKFNSMFFKNVVLASRLHSHTTHPKTKCLRMCFQNYELVRFSSQLSAMSVAEVPVFVD